MSIPGVLTRTREGERENGMRMCRKGRMKIRAGAVGFGNRLDECD